VTHTSGVHVRLVTFADGSLRWRLAGQRLERQASRGGWFSSIHRWTAQALHRAIPQFQRDNPGLAVDGVRGYGYWLWRPYILAHELRSLEIGECLLFLDAGCQMNQNPLSLARFQTYLDMTRDHGNLIMEIEEPLDRWCKRDLLAEFSLGQSPGAISLIEPGVFFLAKTKGNEQLIANWIRWGQAENYHYIDDSPSSLSESSEFREHRHDQAILTCLSTRHSIQTLPQETYFPHSWRQQGANYPIWALRNNTPFNLEGTGPISNIVTKLRNSSNR